MTVTWVQRFPAANDSYDVQDRAHWGFLTRDNAFDSESSAHWGFYPDESGVLWTEDTPATATWAADSPTTPTWTERTPVTNA